MKLILCTLSICFSILASVFTTKTLIRDEGKKIRSSIPKTLAEPLDAAGHQALLAPKLDAINAQLASVNRRMTLLEDAVAKQPHPASADTVSDELQALKTTVNGLATSLSRIGAMPGQLAELTTFCDRSFEHLEKQIADTATPAQLTASLDDLVKKIDLIESYFPSLYSFLGAVYDPNNAEPNTTYPSVDARINELFQELAVMYADVSFIRERLTLRAFDPEKHPR